ncbi:stage III sporulation protein AF [Clostridium sp. CAG:492]|nr:stage III sporulation protein AF [Clostridium sp. CAG:492]
MLEWFRSWATGIVIAVIIATIIEMILPNSTSKKYIKIIIGIFIVYTIISPVIGSFKGEDLNNYIKVENYIQSNSNALQTNEVSDNAQSSIKKIYSQNLQNDLKTKLKEKGYISNNINISISNDDKYNIERIDIKVDEKVTNSNQDEKQVKTIVDNIKAIKIKVKKDDSQNNAIITENDKNEIKEYIKQIYQIDLNNINVS